MRLSGLGSFFVVGSALQEYVQVVRCAILCQILKSSRLWGDGMNQLDLELEVNRGCATNWPQRRGKETQCSHVSPWHPLKDTEGGQRSMTKQANDSSLRLARTTQRRVHAELEISAGIMPPPRGASRANTWQDSLCGSNSIDPAPMSQSSGAWF